jgi:sterol desaturase/sphingolipid hydroxylase (fatty acid hydroxylase superfamily)
MPLTLFHHANVTVPRRLDRALATLVVTPGVHRMHHSPAMAETNSNYGQMFSFWDRLFGTWTPPDYDRVPAYGLERLSDARWQGVAGMLTTPFRAWRLGAL